MKKWQENKNPCVKKPISFLGKIIIVRILMGEEMFMKKKSETGRNLLFSHVIVIELRFKHKILPQTFLETQAWKNVYFRSQVLSCFLIFHQQKSFVVGGLCQRKMSYWHCVSVRPPVVFEIKLACVSSWSFCRGNQIGWVAQCSTVSWEKIKVFYNVLDIRSLKDIFRIIFNDP